MDAVLQLRFSSLSTNISGRKKVPPGMQAEKSSHPSGAVSLC
jgi:hypothetical protein